MAVSDGSIFSYPDATHWDGTFVGVRRCIRLLGARRLLFTIIVTAQLNGADGARLLLFALHSDVWSFFSQCGRFCHSGFADKSGRLSLPTDSLIFSFWAAAIVLIYTSQIMSVRRRRSSGASATNANNHQDSRRTTHAPTQPIDEGEQETIVKNLRANTIKITNELCNIVILACAGAAALTVIFPLLIAYVDNSTRDEPKGDLGSHLLYTSQSCLSHCLMAYIAHVSKFPLRWNPSFAVRTASTHSALYASAVISTVVQLLFVGHMNWDALGGGPSSVDPVTIGQMIGNLCTLLAALFVAMDSVSTEDVLRKHDGSRYGFKSL